MAKYVALSRDLHQGKCWKAPSDFKFVDSLAYVAVFLPEIGRLLPNYTLAFVKKGEEFDFVALLSLLPNTNAYVDNAGRWLAPYIPALIRSFPFLLAKTEDEKFVLAVAEDFIVESGGIPFFDGEALSKEAQEVLNFLLAIEREKSLAKLACQRVVELNLLEPWEIIIKTDGGEAKLEGIYKINEKGLMELSDDDFVSLRRAGSLPIIYGQLFSAANLQQLARLTQEKLRLTKSPSTPSTPEKRSPHVEAEDLERLLQSLKFPED